MLPRYSQAVVADKSGYQPGLFQHDSQILFSSFIGQVGFTVRKTSAHFVPHIRFSRHKYYSSLGVPVYLWLPMIVLHAFMSVFSEFCVGDEF